MTVERRPDMKRFYPRNNRDPMRISRAAEISFWRGFGGILSLSVLLLGALSNDLAASDENYFVTAQSGKFKVGNKEFFAKGVNYMGGRFLSSYTSDGTYEVWSPWEFLHTFNPQGIEQELAFLKTHIGINTIRILTPSVADWANPVTYNGWEPWFLSDGAINPLYLARLQTLLTIARKYGIRIHLELLHSVKLEGLISPGSPQETFYKTYLASLVPALKNDPTLLSYEVTNENLLDASTNYW